MKSLKLAVLAISLVGILGVGNAMALDTANLTVSAIVDTACNITNSGNIDFGTLDPVNGPVTTLASVGASAGAVTVACTQDTDYSLSYVVTDMTDGTNTITFSAIPAVVPADHGLVAGRLYVIDAQVAKTAYDLKPAGSYVGQLAVTVNY